MAEKFQRCAIYTRKSTEDGLEQEFNSLDAQYEACAAYALSQQHEGWSVIKERYDDGGFSGGNLERPGLTRLLADLEGGKVDIVLLYKIDRLTRSLTDFARIVEVMDKAGASFVSITQSFNTTTSMGRLTLNMLLSFAQFEREVTGERIRDKIAASKKKGMWMGGPVPLGYKVEDRKLLVQQEEAKQVRHIMQRYLALGTVPALADELNREGYKTKVQQRTSGPQKGGCIYRRGTLYHLLSNRIYRGMIVHKGNAYPGEHEAIIEEGLWNKVQKRLEQNASGPSRRKKHQHPSLLIGKLFDGEGRAMTPSHAQRASKRYRYYVTRPDQLDGSPAWRVNAHDLEALVCSELASKLGADRSVLALIGGSDVEADRLRSALEKADKNASVLRSGAAQAKAELLNRLVEQIWLEDDQINIAIKPDRTATLLELEVQSLAEDQLTLTVPAVQVRKGHQLRLAIPGSEEAAAPTRQGDDKLIALIAEAHEARKLILQLRDQSIASIAKEQGKCRTRLGKLIVLACMAPDIVKDILQGQQPQSLTAKQLMKMELPLDWNEQRLALGYSKR